MKPLVSILIPAFNAERWISQTLASALAQTWPCKEIIVVDDGSTDGTFAAAASHASKFVHVETQPNQGAQVARNRALTRAQGDYIQWLDADDLLAADKIERQLSALGTDNTVRTLLSGPWGGFFYRVEKAAFTASPLWRDATPLEWFLRKLESGSHMQTATWLVSRRLTEAAGPWDSRLLVDQDGEYFCRVKLAADGIKFVADARTYYRRTGSERVSYIGHSRVKQESLLRSLELLVGYVLSLEDSPRTRAACARYLQKRLIDVHPDNVDIAVRIRELAGDRGAALEFPLSPARYRWVQSLFGWRAAECTRRYVRAVRTGVAGGVDRTLFELNRSRRFLTI